MLVAREAEQKDNGVLMFLSLIDLHLINDGCLHEWRNDEDIERWDQPSRFSIRDSSGQIRPNLIKPLWPQVTSMTKWFSIHAHIS